MASPSTSLADAGADPVLTKGERTQRAILRAAIARFGRDGYRATSVADIARDAGVGGTVPYQYFEGKEALFLAAVDEDAAGVIRRGLFEVIANTAVEEWRRTLVFHLVEAVEHHPLARRLLSGQEPGATTRVLDIPALADLRAATAERLRAEQDLGRVRRDVDPVTMANGVIAIVMSLVMSVLQIGTDASLAYASDVAAVFDAALNPPQA